MTFRTLIVILLSQAAITFTSGKESESFDIPLASDPNIAKTIAEIKAVSASYRTYSIYEDGHVITAPSKTIKEGCAKYADIHFEGAPSEERTFYAFFDPDFNSDESEAEIELLVAYEIWGYKQLLKFERKEKMWVLDRVHHTARFSFESGDSYSDGYSASQTLIGTRITTDATTQEPQQGGSGNPDKPDPRP